MKNNHTVLLVNETFVIGDQTEKSWCSWMEGNYIKSIDKTNLVKDIVLSKVLSGNSVGGSTFALQFKIAEVDLDLYKKLPELIDMRRKMNKIFKDTLGSFVTILEIIVNQK